MDNKSVNQAKKLLQRRRTSRPRFKLPCTPEQAEDLLTAAVIAEVQYRHREPVLDMLQLDYIKQAARWLTAADKFGLIIMGTVGNGKTTLLRAIAGVVDVLDFRDQYGNRLKCTTRTAKQIAQLRKDSNEKFRDITERPMLAIDDFGEEAGEVLDYGNVINPLVDLLSVRYDAQLPTIITTNVSNDEIRKKYGDRIADRFNEMMQVIIFTNPSRRRNPHKTP